MQLGIITADMDGIKAPFFDGTQPCAYEDPEIFFPEPAEPKLYRKQQEAKAICKTCAFVEDCLDYALTTSPLPLGIWGATTEAERKRLRARRRK